MDFVVALLSVGHDFAITFVVVLYGALHVTKQFEHRAIDLWLSFL